MVVIKNSTIQMVKDLRDKPKQEIIQQLMAADGLSIASASEIYQHIEVRLRQQNLW